MPQTQTYGRIPRPVPVLRPEDVEDMLYSLAPGRCVAGSTVLDGCQAQVFVAEEHASVPAWQF